MFVGDFLGSPRKMSLMSSLSSPRKSIDASSTNNRTRKSFRLGLNFDLNLPNQTALTPKEKTDYDDSVTTDRINMYRKKKENEQKRIQAMNMQTKIQRQLSKIYNDKKEAADQMMADKGGSITTDSFGKPLRVKKVKEDILERPFNGDTDRLDYEIKEVEKPPLA